MNFTSPIFFIFLPTVLILYQLFSRKYRLPLLLIASYLFYAYYDVRLLSLIFLTTLVSYISARCMDHSQTKKERKTALVFTMFTCLGILFLFKYLNFSVAGICTLFNYLGVKLTFSGFDILLPMGISFYVFQTMSYTFDVYQGKRSAEKHLGYYALFVVFFPQLVAGPIERPDDLLPQLKECPSPNGTDFMIGFQFMLRGYAKKLLIADFLAVFVDIAYDNIETAGGSALLGATIFFAIQIYCDFSGYSDIATGCASFLGIRLSENFHSPYEAVSIRDFWRRWHISLTRWFTDYLFIPLGGSRHGLLCHCRNIMITFLVSGLWHGANLTYVIWGGLHGLFLVIETVLFQKDNRKRPVFHRAITFLLVCFAWIFFRASSVSDALFVLRSIALDFHLNQLLPGLGISQVELLIVLLLLFLLPRIEKLPSYGSIRDSDSPAWLRTTLLYFVLSLSIMICRCYILTRYGSGNFIYFQF